MRLNEGRGTKTSQWFPNEILRNDDINNIGRAQYQNISDMFAVIAGDVLDSVDVVISGLRLTHTTDLTCSLSSGGAVSSQGTYLNADSWGFTSLIDGVFATLVPDDEEIAFSAGGAQDRIDIVEIRPVEILYNAVARTFQDPVTKARTTSVTNTRKEYGYEFAVREGVEDASPVAVNRTAGWIKLAEVYVASGVSAITDANITTFVDSISWTADSETTRLFHGIGGPVTSFPTSPLFGEEVWRDDLDAWFKYNGTVWVQI